MAAVLIAFLSLANLLAPEMSWDAMTYQLILPKFYLLNHGFYPALGMVPAHYPSLGQMFFSWGSLWGNDSLARSFCFLAHVGTALALVALGTRLKNEKTGWFAAIFYWAFPYLNIFSTRGYVDLFVGFYAVLGLGALILWVDGSRGDSSTPQKQTVKVFGFLGAWALSAIFALKYNAISFWLAGATILLTSSSKNQKQSKVWLGLAIVPVFFFGVWGLKSWIYTGNPVFPYLSNLFTTFGWSDYDQRASSRQISNRGLAWTCEAPGSAVGNLFQKL